MDRYELLDTLPIPGRSGRTSVRRPRIGGRFELLERLGAGAVGEVYKACQGSLGRPVALKILHPELARDNRVAARFAREARAASRLDHAHILRVLDFGEDRDGALFIAMELIDGENLEQVVERGPLGRARVLRVMEQLLSALAAAHDAGIVHRDIKPANVMLTLKRGDDGWERETVKVCDFGLAKAIEDVGQAKLTLTGFVYGTPAYMAPEQAQGAKAHPSADLYAAGALLFQLCTGRVPFDGSSVTDVLLKHLNSPLPSFASVGCASDSGLEAIVSKAMAKDPARRFRDARAMRDAVRSIRARPLREREATGATSASPRRVWAGHLMRV